jgi:hypothetical protein
LVKVSQKTNVPRRGKLKLNVMYYFISGVLNLRKMSPPSPPQQILTNLWRLSELSHLALGLGVASEQKPDMLTMHRTAFYNKETKNDLA